MQLEKGTGLPFTYKPEIILDDEMTRIMKELGNLNGLLIIVFLRSE